MSDSSAKHGAAQLSCEGGCSCRARKYHFTHPYPGLSRVSVALPHGISQLQVVHAGSLAHLLEIHTDAAIAQTARNHCY